MAAVLKKSENVVFRKIENEYILVPIVASAADVESIFNLNETGAAVWEKIDGKRKLGEILGELRDEFEDEGQLEHDVLAFLDEMTKAKLIEAS